MLLPYPERAGRCRPKACAKRDPWRQVVGSKVTDSIRAVRKLDLCLLCPRVSLLWSLVLASHAHILTKAPLCIRTHGSTEEDAYKYGRRKQQLHRGLLKRGLKRCNAAMNQDRSSWKTKVMHSCREGCSKCKICMRSSTSSIAVRMKLSIMDGFVYPAHQAIGQLRPTIQN